MQLLCGFSEKDKATSATNDEVLIGACTMRKMAVDWDAQFERMWEDTKEFEDDKLDDSRVWPKKCS